MARIFGITSWEIVDLGPDHVEEPTVQGFRSPHRWRAATGTVLTATGPVTFELIRPLEGWGIYQEWLITRGEGIVAMAIVEIDAAAFGALKPWLAAERIDIAQSYRCDGVVDRVHLDTRAALGGCYVELLVAQAGLARPPGRR